MTPTQRHKWAVCNTQRWGTRIYRKFFGVFFIGMFATFRDIVPKVLCTLDPFLLSMPYSTTLTVCACIFASLNPVAFFTSDGRPPPMPNVVMHGPAANVRSWGHRLGTIISRYCQNQLEIAMSSSCSFKFWAFRSRPCCKMPKQYICPCLMINHITWCQPKTHTLECVLVRWGVGAYM